jgi:L-asparaginase
MTIRLLITGGTIDKAYNPRNGELHFVDTHIPERLGEGRNRADIEIETLMLKDSLEMTEDDRSRIAEACRGSAETRLIVTHGTDTLTESAQALRQLGLDKTIVLVGAMLPWVLRHSDAAFNLGAAVVAVQCLPAGVYVVMNGSVFAAGAVRKNREQGVFEAI